MKNNYPLKQAGNRRQSTQKMRFPAPVPIPLQACPAFEESSMPVLVQFSANPRRDASGFFAPRSRLAKAASGSPALGRRLVRERQRVFREEPRKRMDCCRIADNPRGISLRAFPGTQVSCFSEQTQSNRGCPAHLSSPRNPSRPETALLAVW